MGPSHSLKVASVVMVSRNCWGLNLFQIFSGEEGGGRCSGEILHKLQKKKEVSQKSFKYNKPAIVLW